MGLLGSAARLGPKAVSGAAGLVGSLPVVTTLRKPPAAAEAIALASDCTAFAVATAGRLARWPRLPRSARLAVAWADNQPRLRRALQTRIGSYGADVVLCLGNAALHGLTQESSALVVDALHRGMRLAELNAVRIAWSRWENVLREPAEPTEAAKDTERPCPLPRGPVEKWADHSSLAALAAATGVTAFGRDPGAAGDVMLAMVPQAAGFGRVGFTATLGRALAQQGILPLDDAAYRRLDCVTAVAVDSAALRGTDLETDADGPEVLDPRAEAVLAAARDGGVRILLTEHPTTAELLPLVDDALDASVPLAEHVRALQRDGEGVLVITTTDEDAASAADVGVTVTDLAREPICRGSDLICTGGLEQVWRLMTAVGAARDASERSVRLAVGGSALGTLLVLTTRRARSPSDLAPVHSAALIALISGLIAARRLAARPAPVPVPRISWHALDPLDAAERALRLRETLRGGDHPTSDRVPKGIRAAPPVRAFTEVAVAVRHELRDPLTPVLVLGAAASAVVGSGIDAALVGGVMAGNALISGVQRARAERALRGLLLGQRPPARRVHVDGPPAGWELTLDGDWAPYDDIPAADLRPGDVIAVGSTDVVPADARLLVAEDLEVDEATLTGESTPVPKSLGAVPGADLSERSCMLYEQTTVLTGRAYAVVVATGTATQAGRAAALAGKGAAPTGVQAQLNELTRVSLPVTGVSGALVSALGVLRGMSARRAISSGVAVAVAAVPEGLTLVATVAQLAAARRLSRRGVLVRSSRTLGTLGRADVVCFDKTGTLTEGRLAVTTISGPLRDLDSDGERARGVLTTAARACPAADGSQGKVRHATDRAVLAAAARVGDDKGWEPLHAIPFEPSRGYSAASGRDEGAPYVAVKGAPEVVLPHCGRVVTGRGTEPMTAERRAGVERTVHRLAGRGLRVLAVAGAEPANLDDEEEILAELALLGFVGIADPPHPAAAEAIGTLTGAGIRVAMITGDHPDTARAVAAELGVPHPERALTGAELDRLSDRDRTERIARTSVFARVTPEHKVRIVQALQRAGRVVAMTGDGANDAAAIRLADVGIGLTAGDSRAAQSAADLILRGGDLPGIVAALLEGRALGASVRNAVSILVGGNAGEVAFTLYGTALSGGAPLTTRQLLLVNMLTDMMPALAVALAPPDGDHVDRAARPSRRGVLGDPLHQAIVARGVVTALGAMLAWQIGRFTGRHRRAGTMGLAALVITQLAQTLQTGWRSPAVLATCAASLLVLAAVIETPGVSHFFGCVPLGPAAWTIVLATAAATAAAPRLTGRGAWR